VSANLLPTETPRSPASRLHSSMPGGGGFN
jgi:hypothetical protein